MGRDHVAASGCGHDSFLRSIALRWLMSLPGLEHSGGDSQRFSKNGVSDYQMAKIIAKMNGGWIGMKPEDCIPYSNTYEPEAKSE